MKGLYNWLLLDSDELDGYGWAVTLYFNTKKERDAFMRTIPEETRKKIVRMQRERANEPRAE